ncbi:glycosyltransferase family 25 protein [Rhizobium sp. P28RR-XV]|uniref:glycosyltransferase family 25 protein n=1 Tax=Rhizobium sp. P28RR-XV TaxID=2726737 RepID=UPI0028A8B68C|nr:glycosyltransferase family 25 protein [Rhizobium sp. P28RR-XV]
MNTGRIVRTAAQLSVRYCQQPENDGVILLEQMSLAGAFNRRELGTRRRGIGTNSLFSPRFCKRAVSRTQHVRSDETVMSPPRSGCDMVSTRQGEASLTVFLINLDRAVDRLVAMQQKLGCIGLHAQRVSAVDGAALDFPIRDFNEVAFRFKHGRRRNPAEVGCYLSHIECARRLLASNSEFALVLEDDLEFPDDFAELLDATLQQNEKWDILRLSTVSDGRKFRFSRLTKTRSLAVALTREKGSGAYIINRRAAHWFVEKLVPMQLPFDLAFDLEFFGGLKSAFVVPVPVDQQLDLPSQIQGRRRRYHRSRGHYLTVMPYRIFIETIRLPARLMCLVGHLTCARMTEETFSGQTSQTEKISAPDSSARRIG